MASKVIKFVAGGGKTTISLKILNEKANGLYLAFTNSVVNSIYNKGCVAKTIDGLFFSFILPKFYNLIPIISNCSETKYINNDERQDIRNIHISSNGKIMNQSKNTDFNMYISNDELQKSPYKPNLNALKFIFSKDCIRLNNSLLSEISDFIITNYKELIIKILEKRFDYIIIDEAQDLKGYREKFAKILYDSNICIYLLGDDNQNINGGGEWFESLKPAIKLNRSYRCPESNCEWIRKNIGIDIQGENKPSRIEKINLDEIFKLDDGNRVLLYNQDSGKASIALSKWKGPRETIKSAKGLTIENDIVIVSSNINKKNLYTAITRTKSNCYLVYDKLC